MWGSPKFGSALAELRQACSPASMCRVSILARPSSKKARACGDLVLICIPLLLGFGSAQRQALSASIRIHTWSLWINEFWNVMADALLESLGQSCFCCGY